MSAITSGLSWVPAAAVGAAAAVAAEMAIALLLYVGGGFLGSLTLILCVAAVSFALGLWSAPRDTAPPWAGVRRAWFLLMLTYVAGALVAGSWEALGGLGGSWASRGIGLAFLAALPLYATGLVLGAPALPEGDPPASAGPPAALGAAWGFALVGLGRSGLRLAAFPYVSGVVVIATGALVHSRLLAARERRWREWAERGAARADLAAGAPEAPVLPLAQGPRIPSATPPPPGEGRPQR